MWLSAAVFGVALAGTSGAFAQTKWDLPGAYGANNFHSKN
ncbi:MAG: C4-dicarboxylate ABC transporter substrate-binding protein, partial [Ferrovibrio sp.]